jgi:uncharacterized SAM-binding protein YcdF (DUF218 family)/glycosyltransferase involved in cell wall biosynthesis
MTSTKHNIVCISTIDWDFVWQGHQEIMSTLASEGNRVLFIENTGVRSPSLRDIPRIRQRLANWRRSIKGIRQVADNLYVYSPLVLPFPYSKIARLINRWIMTLTLRAWGRTMEFYSPIIWTWLPTALALDLIKALHGKLTIYYCFDNFEAISEKTRRIRETERVLIKQADLVFATARNLYDHCIKYNANVYLFPSGFSGRIFSTERRSEPADLAHIPRPILGYVGGIHELIDFALLEDVAARYPNMSLVFVGPLQTDVGRIKNYPNVHFLGQKQHSELPDYIAQFDVCMIPYVLSEYTKNVYPTKLNEYLILGKPVVCTAIPELQHFNATTPDVLAVAQSRDEFVAAIQSVLQEDSVEARARRVKAAEGNSWEQKIEAMTSLIDGKLEEKAKVREQAWQTNLANLYKVAKRKAGVAVGALALSYMALFHTPLLWWIAEPLQYADLPAKSDVIVVLAGGIGESGEPGEHYQEKVKQGVELYKQGYAPKLIFSSGVHSTFNEARIMKALAVSLDVPEDAIILDELGGGNYASLLNAKRIMDPSGWTKVLLVTSRYNTARSKLVADKNLSGITVTLTPAQQSRFFGERQQVEWKHLRAIAHEYVGILYYRLKGYI